LYQSSNQGGSFPSTAGTTNIFLGQAAVSQALVSLLATPLAPFTQVTDASTRTISAQSMLQVIDPLSVLLGVSYSKPDETETTLGVAQDFDLKGEVSYRAGLNYEFVQARTNAYFSYSQSFNPQLVLDINNNVLPPLIGSQYELGLKRRSESGRLLLTGALFQIDEKNVSEAAGQTDATEYYQAIGEVRHRGLELQAIGQITPQWQVNVGYAYLDPKITGATASQSATIGQTQLYLPKQTASLYTTYSLEGGPLSGFSFGGGVHFVSSQDTSYSTLLANQQGNPNQETTPGFSRALPGYTLFDATLRYAIDKWVVQFNAHNIFNKEYFINNYQSLAYGNAPGTPANVTLSVRRTF
jgi:iron complex outermembrane receptor protein